MDDQQGNQIDAAYIAGLWEADGHIGISKNHTKRKEYWRVQCTFRNTDYELCEEVYKTLRQHGFGAYTGHSKTPNSRKNTKPTQHVTLYGWGKVARFLEWIIPHMRGHKRLVAKVVYSVAEIGRPGYRIPTDVQEYREWAYAVLRNLNHRGLKPSETTIPAPPSLVDEGIVHAVIERLG